MNSTDAHNRHEAGTTPYAHTTRLINSETAAMFLGIGERTLWSLTKRNAMPVHRIGRAVRYCPLELDAWVRAGCPTEPNAADTVRKGVRR